jgi:hypothetical protein
MRFSAFYNALQLRQTRASHLVKVAPVAVNRLPQLRMLAKQGQLLAICCAQLLLLKLQVGHGLLLRHHPAAFNSSRRMEALQRPNTPPQTCSKFFAAPSDIL